MRRARKAVASVPYAQAFAVLADGPAPLAPGGPALAERTPLHVAIVLPSLPAGSGGHMTVLRVTHGLEQRGHTCSLWLLPGAAPLEWEGALRRKVHEHYAPVQAPVFRGFEHWYGADVAVATSWETAYAVAALPATRARAYLLNDNEAEFYGTSVERTLAERSFELGLHGLAGTPWLAEVYPAPTSPYSYGVDHATYFPRDVPRRRDTVVYYARASTPRRAVPLGLQALHELTRRRPATRVVLFGGSEPAAAPFAHEDAGRLSPDRLAELFSSATAGLSLSLTNPSLAAHEMLACGLPCVELDTPATRASLPGVPLAPFDPRALAEALAALLDDPAAWQRRHDAGLDLVRERTWERSAAEVEAGLREALRRAA